MTASTLQQIMKIKEKQQLHLNRLGRHANLCRFSLSLSCRRSPILSRPSSRICWHAARIIFFFHSSGLITQRSQPACKDFVPKFDEDAQRELQECHLRYSVHERLWRLVSAILKPALATLNKFVGYTSATKYDLRCEIAGTAAYNLTMSKSRSTSWDALENDPTKHGGTRDRFQAPSQQPFVANMETIEEGDRHLSPTKPQSQTSSHPTPTTSQVDSQHCRSPVLDTLGFPVFPEDPMFTMTVDLSFLDDVEGEEFDICATEERNCQGGCATEELHAQEFRSLSIGECSEQGALDEEEWPTFSTPYFMDAHAFKTYKDSDRRTVRESPSWVDVVKGNTTLVPKTRKF